MVAALIVLGFMMFLFAVLGVSYMKGNGAEMINIPEKRKAEWDKKSYAGLSAGSCFFCLLSFC